MTRTDDEHGQISRQQESALPERPVAIPPDPQAVRDAMRPPPRAHGRIGPLLVVALLVAMIGAFLVPKTPPPVDQQSDPVQFGEPQTHDEGIRFLLQLESDPGGRVTELECMLVFSFAAAEGELQGARQAIQQNWSAAAERVAECLQKRTRREFVHSLEVINDAVKLELTGTLFPDGRGKVESVGWRYLKFR